MVSLISGSTILAYVSTTLLLLLILCGEPGDSLSCWQCIADDCHTNPADYHKATIKHCEPDQSCQKVEYRGRDMRTKTDYFSVTRSCSQGPCIAHADNCTEQLLTNPGCMIRHCCHGHSLCNGAQSRDARLLIPLVAACLIAIGVFVVVL